MLKKIPSEIVAFSDFAAAHPKGLVLSRMTGYSRPYGRNPYAGYDRIDQPPFLFTGKTDERLPPMERVLSVSVGGKHRLYPLSLLDRYPAANRELGGVPYLVFVKPGMSSPLDSARTAEGRAIPAAAAFDRRLEGRLLSFEARDAKVHDAETGSEWNILGEVVAGSLKGKRLAPVASGVHFAFAWLAFNPNSEIVRSISLTAGRAGN